MKRIPYIIISLMLVLWISCKEEVRNDHIDDSAPAPAQVSNVTVRNTHGGAVLKYKLPELYDTTSLYSPAGFEKQYPERFKKFTEALSRAFNNPEYKANLEKTGQIGRFRVLTINESRKVADDIYTLYKENINLLKK